VANLLIFGKLKKIIQRFAFSKKQGKLKILIPDIRKYHEINGFRIKSVDLFELLVLKAIAGIFLMRSSIGVQFLSFLLIVSLVGCESAKQDVQDLVDDSLDKALNAPNTDYINPDRLADTKEEALRQAHGFKQAAPAGIPVKAAPAGSSFNGTLVIVNRDKDFAVVDFSEGPVPAVGTELSVHRGTRAVGSIKITDPIKGPLASADIVNGVLVSGDIVLK
jgi:hypothetical protein